MKYIGAYQGIPVYTTNIFDYTKDKIDNPFIYAIKQKNSQKMDLVYRGHKIGILLEDGNILEIKKGIPWKFPSEKKEEKKSKDDIDFYDFSVDFSAYDKTVNDVFSNLSDWWKNLERE